MRLFRLNILAGLAGLTVAGLLSATAWAQPVAISTLPPGAINNVQAQAIAKVIQENSDLQMRVVTFNSPAAIMGAAQNAQAEFAFTSNDEAGTAVRGQDEHEGKPMSDLRLAASIFPFKVGIAVRKDSDIKSVADLKGKRFATGWQGFKQGIPLFNAMLATEGLSLDDADAVPATNLLRAADDFKAGKTDAFIFAVGAPKVAEIDSAVGGIRWLNLDDSPEAQERMAAVRPEYHVKEQKPLPHLVGVEGPTNLMEYYIVLLTNKDVSEDVVYEAVKALYNNKEGLVAGHPSFNAFTAEGMAVPQPGMEYHPGAIRFFKEAGIWKD
ncbi:TAXI family TRAP transporter solute-binding subunit [Microbaculum marinum]|uniref:TAXI family TRAP transporter solute-binding subunit n=1 Tax=Microbaculum marinum TaxID=1764581 RepID=A0AAW9RSR9_9HYPH